MAQLKGKVAIVTGASKGIGAGIAKALAAAGASVVVNYASSKEGADQTVAEITRKGGKAVAVQGDMANAADVQRLFAETRKSFDKVNIVVNNAGVYNFDPIEAVSEQSFHRHFNTNVLGPILVIQEALKVFGPEGGNVINISSVAGTNPPPMASVYSATKSALDSITRSLSRELGPKNIRVNSISPGFTETEGVHNTPGLIGGDMLKDLLARTPLGRAGQPEDIASAVVYLASDESAWITGENIRVAGGLS